MRFVVNQISPTIELVFADAEEFINVYPTYHQSSGLIYANVNRTDWHISGSHYIWETNYPNISTTTVPVIQLIYSYNATPADKQAQYEAFRKIRIVETLTGKLRLYAEVQPSDNFRIRYRLLDKMDLAISLNRPFAVGIGYSARFDRVASTLSSTNPITNQAASLGGEIPIATCGKAGAVSGDIIARLKKLEDEYDQSLTQPYRITGYDSDFAVSPITTYYADIASITGISANTWYRECSIYTRTDVSDFIIADSLFYQQHATMLDLTHIYTGNVTSFSYALASNVVLQSIKGLQLMDTHNVTDISYMFADDEALEEIDLSTWCLDKVTNIEGLFYNCTSLQELNITSIDFTPNPETGVSLITQPDIFTGVPDNCTIWVSGESQRAAILSKYPNLTGITYN